MLFCKYRYIFTMHKYADLKVVSARLKGGGGGVKKIS
jgi:hypothetical protein